jgi:hypothetical protein
MTVPDQPLCWDMSTGDLFRLYKGADEMTRDNIVLGLHLKVREQGDELRQSQYLVAVLAVGLITSVAIVVSAAVLLWL